ncbi:MAG: CYTH and CHAD domain-containing protein [Parvibaculaceae bacterium]
MGHELELKLSLDEAEMDRLPACGRLAQADFGTGEPRKLKATYFDNEANALRRRGVMLRLRNEDGRLIQTLKGKKAFGSLAAGRAEYETRVARNRKTPDLNRLPGDLKERLTRLLDGSRIEAKFETDVDRTIGLLQTDQGDRIELALDRGVIRAGRREVGISELELELKKGNPASLYRLALELVETVPMRIGVRSKGERGYALANAKGPMPVKGETVRLRKNATAEEALETILRHCLAHIVANEPALVDAADGEALHQMRVALRRLRAALDLFHDILEPAMAADLSARAKALAGALGDARDLDVFRGELIKPLKEPGAEDIAALDRAAARAQMTAWDSALRTVRARAFTRTCLTLALYIEEKGWRASADGDPGRAMRLAMPARKLAARALDKRLKKARQLARRIDELQPDERHELRKRLKSLRYAAGFFSDLYPKKRVRKQLKRLTRLQDVFGSLNDLAVADEIIRDLTGDPTLNEDRVLVARGAGRVLGWHGAKAEESWAQARDLWRRFHKAEPFWRG